jgi:hypothetical protein
MRWLFVFPLALALAPLWAQEDDTPPEPAMKPPVLLTFTPPGLEGTIVMGIFDDAGKLRRTLRFEPGAPELKIDTNGYVAQWDGCDEAGKLCAASRYSAHGYVVGEEVKVEGEAFHFNDWMAEDQIPAQDADLRQWPGGMGVALRTARGLVYERIQTDGTLAGMRDPMDWAHPGVVPAQPAPHPIDSAVGRDGSTWVILDVEGQHVVAQFGRGERSSQRELRVPKGEPQPVEILASATEDAILLKEVGAGGLQRVRMLKRGKAAAEKDGRVVADWEVVFERTLQPCANFGVVDGKLVADCGRTQQFQLVTVSLIENALEPGKKPQLRLAAVPMHPGSAWVTVPKSAGGTSPNEIGGGTEGGIAVIQISTAGNWNRIVLGGDATPPDFSIYQGDGVVVEEFLIRNLDHIAAFDAGSFLLESPAP